MMPPNLAESNPRKQLALSDERQGVGIFPGQTLSPSNGKGGIPRDEGENAALGPGVRRHSQLVTI